ncbi:dATP/dGTP pyrophosphohydrolase domain-containing protein [Achromobacter xylosoxidans]
MTNQNNAAQAAEKAIRAAITLLDGDLDHENAETMRGLLSKLRAPVSSIREGFELTYAADADDPACAADLSHFTNGWRACLMSQARAPVADERAALDLLDTLFTAYENGTPCYEEPDSQGGYLGMAFRIDDDTFRACADLLNKERPRTAGALASAPAAITELRIEFTAGGVGYVSIESARAAVLAASRASAPVACNCPGGNKPVDLHAPNCPVRTAKATLVDPYDGGTWLASAPVAGKAREAVDYVRGGALNFDAHPDGAPVAGERAALARLEAACDTLCRLRTQEQYLSMVDSGQQDALLELDGARAQARSALARAPVAKPKCAPIDDGICWSSKEIQRRQKEEDDARAAYYHSRASAPVAYERAVFEKWTGYTEDALSRDAGDGYCIKGVDNQWRAWQASRAALASAPVAKPWPVEEQPDGTVTPVDPVDLASAPVADEQALQAWADRFPEISDMGRLRDAWNDARACTPAPGWGCPHKNKVANVAAYVWFCRDCNKFIPREPGDSAPASAPVTEDDEVERIRGRGPAYPYTPNTAPPTPLASAPVAGRQRLRELVDVVWNEATESTAVPDTPWADRLIDKVFPSLAASAPVAGEAQPLGYVMKGREWPDQCYYPSSHKPTDIHNWTLVFDHAAPQASADAFDFVAHLARQAEFSARTFGPGARVAGVCDHIRKELIEVETSGGDLKEWVDVIILGLDGAWRSGATPQEIIAAVVAKQAKNEARTWPDWRTVDPTKAIEHDRGGQP